MQVSAPAAHALVARALRAMLDGRVSPDAGGVRVWRAARRGLDESPRIMSGLWTVWGALLEPTLLDRDAAGALMLRAAGEWLALNAIATRMDWTSGR